MLSGVFELFLTFLEFFRLFQTFAKKEKACGKKKVCSREVEVVHRRLVSVLLGIIPDVSVRTPLSVLFEVRKLGRRARDCTPGFAWRALQHGGGALQHDARQLHGGDEAD